MNSRFEVVYMCSRLDLYKCTREAQQRNTRRVERRSHLIPIAEMTPSDLSGNIGRSVTYDR